MMNLSYYRGAFGLARLDCDGVRMPRVGRGGRDH